MQSINVCPYCRRKCGKCHSSIPSNDPSHTLLVCSDCKEEYEKKCCVCGGKKTGPGSVGATGPGKTCKKCFKSPSICILCGAKNW